MTYREVLVGDRQAFEKKKVALYAINIYAVRKSELFKLVNQKTCNELVNT